MPAAMLDVALGGFFALLMLLGIRRPFIWILAYIYVDIVAPQKISWGVLASAQLSLIVFVAAFGGWMLTGDKSNIRFTVRQQLMVVLMIYCGLTTLGADFPEDALDKWSWVWKALFFAVFLPMTLYTRLRIEAAALFMTLSVGAIIIDGAIKTVLSGGGYGTLKLFVDNNTGLYEGSTLSMVAISIIPLIIWLCRHGTIFKPNKLVTLFGAALVFSCVLIPIGTAARTGLVCLALLCLLSLRSVKRPFLYLGAIAFVSMASVPFLPESYVKRMGLIENHASDESASTRVSVWMWTLDYVKDHPFGGGFEAYRGNKLVINTKEVEKSGSTTWVKTKTTEDKGRAYHSAYFEMLGEQGWPGLIVWLILQAICLVQLERVNFRLRKSQDPHDKADRALSMALQQGHIVYLFGALFVGIAFQPFILLMISLQIALTNQVARRRDNSVGRPVRQPLQPLNPNLQPEPV
jgi:probable O-glycosylation ligase (exosortase A-associated)